MLSTFTTYQLYTRDQSRVLDRIASDSMNQRLATYYSENIGTVETIDEFMGDYRLYSYAMTAYGLEDQIDSRALIRKVLESDLSDSSSFANQLSDERYRDFAAAFSFGTTTEEVELVAQSDAQTLAMVDSYSEHRVKAAQAVAASVNYFTTNIGEINTVDQFLADDQLFSVALEAAGIDASVASKSFIREVLTGTKADEMSDKGDDRYLLLAAMLPFEENGRVPADGLQSASEINSTAYLYYQQKGLEASPQAAALQASYYEAEIGNIESADDLIENPRLLTVALTAVGLDPSVETSAFVWNVLTSDLSDSGSVVNQMSEATTADATRKQQYIELAKMFQFQTDGSLADGDSAQTAENVTALTDAFLEEYGGAAAEDDSLSASLYAANIVNISTVAGFLANSTVYEYALTAVGLDPAEESKSTIMRVLRSDPSDPSSYASKLGNEAYVRLAAAFNFGSDGELAEVRRVQSETAQGDTIDRYLNLLEDDEDKEAITEAVQDSQTFRSAMASISSIDEFLEDTDAFSYAMKAIGFNPDTQDPDIIRKVLTSDLSDPDSFTNALGIEAYQTLASAFDIDAFGNISLATGDDGTDVMIDVYFDKVLGSANTDFIEAAQGILAYNYAVPEVATMDDFLANTTLVDFALKAFGLDGEKLTSDELRAILTSDLSDPDSVAGKYDDTRYLEFAAAFNFDTDGTIERDVSRVQTVSDMLTTQDLYLRQKMEEEAGDESNGVRLALYFKRVAEDITSVYEFLADDALLEFVTTTLGLPDEFSSSDIDVQARNLEKKIDVEQLGDTEYVERMINRFLAMYDLENDTSGTDPALSILSASSSYI
ncbi:DUF1217 domain-containing protein [Jiella mangrovi]|uniref:DUF1217 domain-containing protein n=1 Tax=Jiella mangrovi TaxID=2821407 RepID=A0ABS4BJU1_9HYPH|nr:DUF1217 domain-containing protein [Jiella mangrovi]MBP0616431.1 DUF1217 domain-containing protein [Jiella mangrovi]